MRTFLIKYTDSQDDRGNFLPTFYNEFTCDTGMEAVRFAKISSDNYHSKSFTIYEKIVEVDLQSPIIPKPAEIPQNSER